MKGKVGLSQFGREAVPQPQRIQGQGWTQSWTWIGSIHGLDSTLLGGMIVAPFFKISNYCSTLDAVSFIS